MYIYFKTLKNISNSFFLSVDQCDAKYLVVKSVILI